MWRLFSIYVALCITIGIVYGHDFKSFDDTIRYKIRWTGKANSDLLESNTNVEPYMITTANMEKYQCLIVHNSEQEQNYNEQYNGPSPMLILSPLFNQNICSHKVESYWTYELCHGKYVRQYHEDRDGKLVKMQEYFLGFYIENFKGHSNPSSRASVPVKKIDGINMPYFEMEMVDGTICDLTNKPRKIKVLYVCYLHGNNQLLSFEEPSTCEYEVVVLSFLLCSHPYYKPQATEENEIKCHPVYNAPKKPRSLVAMEMESVMLRYQTVTDDTLQEVYAVFHVDKEGQDGEVHLKILHPVGVIDKHNNIEDSINSLAGQGISPAEASPVKNFLSGKNCLHGGNGWWKYEFCYGRSVVQYHIERDGKKTIVNLGKFDRQAHIDWIAAHPHKKPKSPELRKQLSHFYSHGTICDKTGNPRQTEVKLKCVETLMSSPSSVSLFLLEPKTCEYVLGVESPLICEILEYADENGLLSEKFEANFYKLKTAAFPEYDDLYERIANGDD